MLSYYCNDQNDTKKINNNDIIKEDIMPPLNLSSKLDSFYKLDIEKKQLSNIKDVHEDIKYLINKIHVLENNILNILNELNELKLLKNNFNNDIIVENEKITKVSKPKFK